MIPPFVKLTIGDLWRDQPGYLKSLSHAIEDGSSWEITDDNQAPHGITMSVTFAILEKNQMDSGGIFYPVGVSRTVARNSPYVGQLPAKQKAQLGTTEFRSTPTNTTTKAASSTNGAFGSVQPNIPSSANRVVAPVSSRIKGFGGGGGSTF
jgi:hypothetical protein